MYYLSLKVKEIQGNEEFNLIISPLSSSSVFNMIEYIVNDSSKIINEEVRLREVVPTFLGLNDVKWQPPASIYDDPNLELHNDLNGDIPLQLFDTLMENIENKSRRITETDETVNDWSDMVNDEVVNEEEAPGNDKEIILVDINKYALPKLDDIECSICGKEYQSSMHLRKHFLKHNVNENKPHFCKMCDEWITDLDSIETHLQKHKER